MAEGVAAADEDLQPLSVPKFPKLKKLSLENRDVQATEYVQALAALPECMDATSRRGGQAVATRCECLHRHTQSDPRLAGRVGLGVASFTAKPRGERIQTLIIWIQYANMMAPLINAKRRQFILIEMRVEDEPVVGAYDEDEPLATQAKLVCQSTLMRLLGIGPNAWKTVNLAAATNTVPAHGLKGKASNFAMGATTRASLHAFFEGLKAHACPRATRFVRTESGFELCDDDEEVMDLPTSWPFLPDGWMNVDGRL